MDQHTLDKLEFERIRQILAGYASSSLGKQMAARVKPAHRRDVIADWIEQVREMMDAAAVMDLPPFGGIKGRSAMRSGPPSRRTPGPAGLFRPGFEGTHKR